MTLKHIVTDLHQVYLTEMEAKIKPKATAGASEKKASGDSGDGGTAEDQVKKAARQLAYDTRYKARRDGIPLERAYTQTLQNSSASGPVKELAKGMLFGGGQKEEVEKISEKPELPPEIFAALRRLENKRQRQGGDKKDSPFPSDKKAEVKKESIGSAIDKTFSAAGEVADTAIKLPVKAVGYAAGLKKGLKKQFKKGQNKANEETQQESIGSAVDKTLGAAGEVADTAIKLPVKAVGYLAGLKKGLKKQAKKGQNKANEEVSIDEAKKAKPASGKKAKKKDKVLVTPVKGQGKQYRRYADAKKKYELRKNPQISSVTGTSYGKTYDEKPEDKKNPGKFPAQKKAKKDFDKDGKLESPKAEYKGSKDKAIKKAIKKQKNEEFSNWKESFEFDLKEIVNGSKKESSPKKIQELKGKNTIIINPKLDEGTEFLGGYVLGTDDLHEEFTEYSIDLAADFFVEEGINEEGVDLIIEEVGVEDFTEFVYGLTADQFIEEERSATKAPKRDYAKVKAAVDKKDAENKAAGKREYSTTKAAKAKYGDEDNTNYDDDAPSPKKKVVATVKKVKAKQPEKKPEKKGIVGKIRGAVAKGMERHKAATKAASKSLKDTAKQHSQHRKDFVKGATPTAKEKKIAGGIAKGVKKAVTGEEVEHIDELKTSTLRNYANKAAIDAVGRGVDAGIKGMTGTKDEMEKNMTKAYKRQRGISRAVNKLAGRAQKAEKKEEFDPSVQEDLHPNIKKIDAASKANVAKQAAKAAADKSAREKTAAAFQAHKKATLAKGGRPVDALDSWHKKKASEEVEIDERLGGKGYSKAAMKSSIHPPSRQSSGDWEDSDRGKGNKATRRAGGEVEAKSPTYIAYIKNKKKKQQEQLDPKKVDAGSAPADQKADSQIANKEKKVAIMKRQILQKKMQAVRSGATADITASYNPVGEDYHSGQGEKIQKRTKEWMKKRGQEGAPGLDAIKARSAEHKAKRGVKEGIDPKGGGKDPDLSPKQQDTERKQTALEREKVAKKRAMLQQMRQQAVSQGKQPTGHTAREEVEVNEISLKTANKAWQARKDIADKVRKVDSKEASKNDEKAINTAMHIARKERSSFGDTPKTTARKKKLEKLLKKEETVVELNRYEKETGKSSGSLNMPKGKPTKKGGDESPVMRAVRSSMRRETGRPEGQQKKAKGVKSDAGTGKYLAKQKAKKDYADKAKKAGFKSTQAYTDTVARYGGESNYKAGRGLGT